MIRYECDRCGVAMGANDLRRFIVKLEVYAAAGHVDLTPDLKGDPQREMDEIMKSLAVADPDEVEDQTYRCFRFDVCDACRRSLLANPLPA
ncbi:MAG: hypothetical protein V1790_04755 [Planctomycetota bacterium]